MAGDTAFLGCAVLVNERSLLLRVTLGAGGVHAFNVQTGARHRVALVRIMAVAAAHLAIHDLVAVRQGELPTLVQMALETGFR